MLDTIKTPKLSILSNGFVLIASGFVVTFSTSGNIDFALTFEDESKLGMHFSFEDDETGKKEISTHTNEDTVYVICKNFTNPWGEGTSRPLKLGEHNGKDIYIGFWLYDLGKLKKVEYCFFMEQ